MLPSDETTQPIECHGWRIHEVGSIEYLLNQISRDEGLLPEFQLG